MSRIRSVDLSVHCSVLDGEGALVERRLVPVPAGASASVVLEVVLRLALEERRQGRALRVDAPAEVAALLALSGLGSAPDALRS